MINDFITPEWVHHAVFYQIFPDRFAISAGIRKPSNLEPWDSPPTVFGFKGGDLIGVADHLDYLQDLGVTAIYFTPIFQSTANHRYHTHDYMLVDPILGGNDALKTLLREAHRRNIHIVLDGVFNHASRGFFQFNHILENGRSSPYLDWFTIKGYPLRAYSGKPNYECWWSLPALPTFNHKNPQVRQYIFDVAKYWVDQGIDGWRLDVPFCIEDDAFWQEFRRVVKAANPQAYITGEIPWDGSRWLQGDQFDGVMNYLLAYCAWAFFGGEKLNRDMVGHWAGHSPQHFNEDTAAFARSIVELLGHYPLPAVQAQLNIFDSHDTARLLNILGKDKARMRLATLFQMTYPGAPCVYYGNEIGMGGGKDPDCRRSFPWDPQRWDMEQLEWFKKCIATRHAHPALRNGEFHMLHAANGQVIYLRRQGSDHAVIALNRTQQTFHMDLPLDGMLDEGLTLLGQMHGGSAQIRDGRLSGWTVAPMSGEIWV